MQLCSLLAKAMHSDVPGRGGKGYKHIPLPYSSPPSAAVSPALHGLPAPLLLFPVQPSEEKGHTWSPEPHFSAASGHKASLRLQVPCPLLSGLSEDVGVGWHLVTGESCTNSNPGLSKAHNNTEAVSRKRERRDILWVSVPTNSACRTAGAE